MTQGHGAGEERVSSVPEALRPPKQKSEDIGEADGFANLGLPH